jgi:5'-nucleotidase
LPIDLSQYFVIGISSRALFDLETEDKIFQENGLKAYSEYQLQHEDDVLSPGAGFSLVKSILHLNGTVPSKRKAEVIVMSQNNADTGLRIFNSIQHHGLDIGRAAFTSGTPISNYLGAFNVSLFLSASEEDVQAATNAGFAAGLIYSKPDEPTREVDELRIAFDGDAVLFSDDSERIYKDHGLEVFLQHEKANAKKALPDGPFAKVLRALALLQQQGDREQRSLIRTALVTARNSPAHERVIRTLREWGVRIDEAFFLGGVSKREVLKAFGAHIFFDDQDVHCSLASHVVPTARVLCAGPPKMPPQRELPFLASASKNGASS